MRLPTLMNWSLLGLNALLFVFLLCVFLIAPWRLPWNPAVRRARSDADAMEMDVFCARSPFAISVAKDFSDSGSFMFVRYGQPLSLLTQAVQPVEEEDGGATNSAMLMLGLEVFLSLEYSYSPNGVCQMHNLSLTRRTDDRSENFFDEDADGSYDTREVRDFKTKVRYDYVFYEGEWREVEEFIGQYHRRLVGGQEVVFDMESGKWRPVTDE